MLTIFDKNLEYSTEIQEKVNALIQACNREKLPVFVAVCVKNDEKGTEYKVDMYASTSNEITLKNDLIPKFVNVTNGFITTPPSNVTEIDFD